MRTVERDRAYAAIDSERDYQDERWGRVGNIEPRKEGLRAPQVTGSSTMGEGVGNRSIDEFALYIHGYSNDLVKIASHTNDPREKLDFIRKVAALCVAAMEQHGAPMRYARWQEGAMIAEHGEPS